MINFGSANLWKLEQQDLGNHYRWANNDNLRRLVGGAPRPKSFVDLEIWFKSVQDDPKQEIYSIKSSQADHVGWVQLTDIDFVSGLAQVGILIDEEYWGQGFGHDSLVALIKYAFEDLRLHRLEAQVLAINLPSLNLFERVGFGREGLKRESYYTSGRYLDAVQMGLLSREFRCPRPKAELGLEGPDASPE